MGSLSLILPFKDRICTLAKQLDAENTCHRICARCMLRYCNVKATFSKPYNDLLIALETLLSDQEWTSVRQSLRQQWCAACLNILKNTFVQEQAQQIADKVNEQGHTPVNEFQLQVRLPLGVTLRNHYWLYILKADPDEYITSKELFRVLLASQLANILSAKFHSEAKLIIELTYTHVATEKECEQLLILTPETFPQKRARNSKETFLNHSSIIRGVERLEDQSLLQKIELNTEISDQCQLVSVQLRYDCLYLAGRYQKYSRSLSQTPWIVDGKSQYVSSVQELIAAAVAKHMPYQNLKFSSSGREDVDVRMLGRGRPFLLEIADPRVMGEQAELIAKITSSLNNDPSGLVKVRDLQFIDKALSQKMVKDGEINKSKTYQALCCLSRPFTDQDKQVIESTKELIVIQKTPVRVLHRRTLSDRTKTIHEMWTEPVVSDQLDPVHQSWIKHIFLLNLTTEAGTYVKEFVHSDFGRTTPNLSTLLGNCSADIITLDVMEVNVDWPPSTEP